MPDDPERHLTLRQADQAPTDFAIIETEMETIHPSARPAAELGRPRAYRPRHHLRHHRFGNRLDRVGFALS